MNDKKKIVSNLIYNIFYQLLGIMAPLLTSPYIARVLGAENIGLVSSTGAIANYFMIFALLGINNYGNRTIASTPKQKRSEIFWNIYAWQLSLSILMGIFYLLYIMIFGSAHRSILFLQGVVLVSTALDITWYFSGKEDFKIVVARNSVVKLLSLMSIFLFVKETDDLWIYVLINVVFTAISQACMWPYAFRELYFIQPSFSEMRKHIRPIIILFIPVLSISIFTSLNKVMIGQISGFIENGYYENANKIIEIPKVLISSLGTVMLPRTAALIAGGREDASKKYIESTMLYVMIVGSALLFGFMAVGELFSVVFWGESFRRAGVLIFIMSPSFMFSVFGNVIRTQHLIPRAKDKEYTISLVAGAIISLVLNSIFIPLYGSVGAAISTVFAEFTLTALQTYFVSRELTISTYLKNGVPFLGIGFMMYLFLLSIRSYFFENVLSLMLFIVLGSTFFVALFLIYIYTIKNNVNKGIKNDVVTVMVNRLKKRKKI